MNQVEDLRPLLKEIDRAKFALMDQPSTTFYSSFLSMLNVRISREIPTAATDGLKIVYNPDFIQSITRPQLLGLTLHEVEHCVNGHCDYTFYKNYCPEILNIAQDHYINLRLLSMGYELPPGGYHDPRFKGMSSMEIYHILIKEGQPQMKPELRDILKPPPGMSPAEHAERILGNIVKAVIIAEQNNDAGSIPGHLRCNLESILSPKLPWTTILQQYLTEFINADYTMRRPNRRFMPNWYLPIIEGEGLGHLVMGCDVSASMSNENISEVWNEYSYIFDTMSPQTAHIMTFDTIVHLDKTYEQGDFIPEFDLEGRGGTNVQPLLDAIRDEQPAFALIFTDGYFSVPNMNNIDSDIFWIIKGNPQFTAPKGTVIHFE